MMPRGRLGTLVASRRVLLGLTQQQLAATSGINRAGLAQIERGRAQWLSPDVVNRLVEALPVSIEELCRAMGYNVTGDAMPELENIDPDALKLLARYPKETQRWIVGEAVPWLQRAGAALARPS